MAIDNSFLIRKILAKTSLICAFCAYTNMPLVVCDEETGNDQVWLFEKEEQLQEFSKAYTEKKLLLRGVLYKKNVFPALFSLLYSLDVNEIVYVAQNGTDTHLELSELFPKPDFSKLPEGQRPVLNPSLQLTGLYFMQEASRQVPNEEKETLKDLEEEFAANLLRSRYLVPAVPGEGEGTLQDKLKAGNIRIPMLKTKDESVFMPAFSDTIEFQKFAKKQRMIARLIGFEDLAKMLPKEAKGIMLNPQGFHAVLTRQLLTGLVSRFTEPQIKVPGQEEEENEEE